MASCQRVCIQTQNVVLHQAYEFIFKNKLRTYACELRKLAKSSTDITVDDLFKKKNEMMVEYHRILAFSLETTNKKF